MNFISFNLPLSQEVIQTFSWTLVHSLWQGLVLAVASGALLLVSRKSRPALRYNLLSALLLLFLVANAFTFWYEYRLLTSEKETGDFIQTAVTSDAAQQGSVTKIQQVTGNQIAFLLDFCSKNAVIIVSVWLIFFLLKSVKATAGLFYIHKLRNDGIRSVDFRWQETANVLAEKLGISSRISLVESELVTVPAVTGFLKPIILVPIGFLVSLPFSQVEAILLHELAHVRRQDYLVNLFQSFAENIFFFNPAVLWISSLIRQEREHCCDDLAIAVMQNKTSFVNALVVFQEYKLSRPAQALAFAGRRNHLLDRIKRIIYNNNKQLNAMEKLFVTISLITVTALSVAFSPPSEPVIKPVVSEDYQMPAKMEPTEVRSLPVVCLDTLPKITKTKTSESSVRTVNITTNTVSYDFVIKDGEMTELKIDGKSIPENEIKNYESELKSSLQEADAEREKSEKQREEAGKQRAEAEVMRKHAEKIRSNADQIRVQADQQRKQAEEIRRQADLVRIDAEKQRKEADVFRGEADKYRKEAAKFREQAEVVRKQADVIRKEAEVTRKEAEKTREVYEKLQADLISDMISEGIIKSKDGLSYKLSNDEFIVNGVKQSAEVGKRFIKKFVKEEGVEMVYNWKGRTGYTVTGTIRSK
ncbi:M56 family metallopeptidase [Dyadobacter psychrotolerans]|uniref:Peptidase M56 BlaR1 n=1 Tax=Dyadobacter psychrotolerans TaxID=2541721 RepID=A0A4R5DTI1_9BACT|nr:M56 family metallopeptidase [Dyadobacter psychrotolerans]TDE15401.1 peptidase M56 BlaR1 [Dyadobacter psychrotolerans]